MLSDQKCPILHSGHYSKSASPKKINLQLCNSVAENMYET